MKTFNNIKELVSTLNREEKLLSEMFTKRKTLNYKKIYALELVDFDEERLNYFTSAIENLLEKQEWNKKELVELFNYMIPNFNHLETGKYLDQKM
jgi:hypothetical protein